MAVARDAWGRPLDGAGNRVGWRGSATPGQIVAAVLLPPLGVYLARGSGQQFVIACALTLIGFVPGAAYGLWVVLRGEPQPATA